MRGWTSAEIAGRCAFDGTHEWKPGARIYRIQGATWTKDYCAMDAELRHQAPPDTGEVLDLETRSNYPTALKALAESAGERFDAKAAAAGKDPEPLFSEAFEEPPV